MSESQISLSRISSLTGLIERLPLGNDARTLARRIGVWTNEAHTGAESRKKVFPSTFSEMNDNELSDTFAFWNSELIRVLEMAGLLTGQQKYLEIQLKKAKAQARSRIRTQWDKDQEGEAKPAKIAAGVVNDEAENDTDVLKVEETIAVVEIAVASIQAYRQACEVATNGLSREISLRQAQFNARLR